jgi:hypothetical protein
MLVKWLRVLCYPCIVEALENLNETFQRSFAWLKHITFLLELASETSMVTVVSGHKVLYSTCRIETLEFHGLRLFKDPLLGRPTNLTCEDY